MTTGKKIPRIQSILQVEGFRVYCLFNTGDKRVIDFDELFKQWNIKSADIEYPLLNLKEFQKVKLREGVLSWENIEVHLNDEKGSETIFPYEIDPLVLFAHSQPANMKIEKPA